MVVRAEPFHCTTEAATKLAPFTVRWNAAVPAVAIIGLRLVMTGIGITGGTDDCCWTVTTTADEVTPRKLVSPEYAAVILCGPTASVLIVKAAVPVPVWQVDNLMQGASDTLPSGAVPSKKLTLPLGVELLAEVTVTVKVSPNSTVGVAELVCKVMVGVVCD